MTKEIEIAVAKYFNVDAKQSHRAEDVLGYIELRLKESANLDEIHSFLSTLAFLKNCDDNSYWILSKPKLVEWVNCIYKKHSLKR